MNINAKAKPIRFTIVSGGEECSSLEMLRENFRVSDVLKSKDRLVRWLKQIGEQELSERVASFVCVDDRVVNMVGIANIFYSNKYASSDSSVNIERMVGDRILSWEDEEVKKAMSSSEVLALNAYKAGVLKEPLTVLNEHSESNNGELLYCLGIEIIKKGGLDNLETGYEYIKDAANKKWDEAIQYITSDKYKTEKEKILKILTEYNSLRKIIIKQKAISDEVYNVCIKLFKAQTKQDVENGLDKIWQRVYVSWNTTDCIMLGFAIVFFTKVGIRRYDKEVLKHVSFYDSNIAASELTKILRKLDDYAKLDRNQYWDACVDLKGKLFYIYPRSFMKEQAFTSIWLGMPAIQTCGMRFEQLYEFLLSNMMNL